jgi:dihydrolipoamide dehydrogenase
MSYDLIVIGSGPGGYVCAIRAAQLGLKTAIVEKMTTYGGTCLNIGCIPSKALLHASEMFDEAGHGFAALGIDVAKPKLNLPAMMKHKQETVDANVKGVEFLLKKNKVDGVKGHGKIVSAGKVEVTAADGATTFLETKAIVIATGSDIASPPGVKIDFDEKVIVSSTGALELEGVPKKLIVIGGGVIGLELGSVWRRLGSEVTVIEYLDRILPGMDDEIAKNFLRIQQKQGVAFKLSSKVTAVEARDVTKKEYKASGGDFLLPHAGARLRVATVTFEPVAGGAAETADADVVLVATGRRPYTDGLGLAEAGVAMERGRVVIDDHFQTNVPGVYAIGDVVRGPMLAHKAEDEGMAVAEILAGQKPHINYDCIPGVVYTWPEVASIGKTEEELKAAGVTYRAGKFPFTANARARATRATDGFVKVLADAATDRVLGCHIIGAGAGDLIHEVGVLMEFGGSSEDLARTCHAHPTMSEAVKEAALAVDKRAIHM